MPEHWLSILYQYVMGGLFFFSVIFVAIKNDVLKPSSRDGKFTLSILLGGFVIFLFVHVVWTYCLMGIEA